jgi:4-amino-4-deoxy-L-arabinose transferase-like glycosyltransferase
MNGLTEFFGKDEWASMFLASFCLVAITLFFLLSRIVLWIALGLFVIAFLFTGYKLFFDKKNHNKGDIGDLTDTIGGIFKK